MPIGKPLPAWTIASVDCETAVEAAVYFKWYFKEHGIEPEDSRYLIGLVADFCEIFQQRHYSERRGYWNDENWLDEFYKLIDPIAEMLRLDEVELDVFGISGENRLLDLMCADARNGWLDEFN